MTKDKIYKTIEELQNTKDPEKRLHLIKSLRAHCQDERVNDVLLPLLSSESDSKVVLAILQTLYHKDSEIIQPLIQLLKQSETPFQIRDEVAKILAQTGEKKALRALLKTFKKEEDPKILDNICFALTFFDQKKVIKPLKSSLENKDLRLKVLTGFARNDSLILSSVELIEILFAIKSTNRFEKMHLRRIHEVIFDKFDFSNETEVFQAIEDGSLRKKIKEYKKEQKGIDRLLRKVEL